MANKQDYLTEYRQFFENFARTVNPYDQLPVKLASYKLVNAEVIGGIIDWTSQYLTQKKCPESLLPTLIKVVIEETRKLCKKQPLNCGFLPNDNAYEPLKLMQTVIATTCEVCQRYLENSILCSLPSPGPPYNQVSAYAVRNGRRRMEDRHVIVHDLSSLFVEQESTPSSYYAIFDGHAGHDAAAYSCAHLHQFLAESSDFISNPEQALREAFIKTDALFLDKCKVESLSSGTTAVCALIHHKEKLLYIAWVGDSQAILVRQGRYVQCVQPHKPSREDEKKRIEKDGGIVLFWDTWRVNGQLAVSRAIGDSEYKPYVTAVPDIVEITLNGTEDFLILACDGLWDCVTEDLAAQTVYSTIAENPDDIEFVSQSLVQLAKQEGSTDNITVIVVFLRETSKIAAEAAHWANCGSLIMDTLDNASTNPFAINTSSDIILQKDGFLLDLAKQNGDATTNGKRSIDEDDEDDLGPETNVDTLDDVLISPVTNHHIEEEDEEEEKAHFETEHIIKSESVKLPAAARDESSTPPADLVNDSNVLLDNVTESCEDSDDEWNYIKGDIADKENVPPSETDKEVCDIIDNDAMSHLNPNAAEFVPLSPKLRTESPALKVLKEDVILAQSPIKGSAQNVDRVPDIKEFESEIKSRPSDIHDDKETVLNFLNGKNTEEIEFHPPNSTPIKTFKADEFHFGPNATPFTTPAKFDTSEALSTKAIFGDESIASYLVKGLDNSFAFSETSISKNQDPMSTSFYQDKDDDEGNPFDLNKVHILPDDIDEFIQKPIASILDDTISDLPEHDPALDLKPEVESGLETELLNIKNKLNVTDSSKIEPDIERNSRILDNLVHSPVDVHVPAGLSESPLPELSPTSEFPIQHSPSIPKTPEPIFSFTKSPVASPTLSHSPQAVWPQSCVPSAPSPTQFDSPVPNLPQSPISASRICTFEEQLLDYQRNADETKVEPLEPFVLQSTMHDLLADIPDVIHSIVPSQNIESPVEDITSSVKDSPLLASSPVCNQADQVFELEEVLELVKHDANIIAFTDDAFLSPESKIETESVATTDVNSFLERSLLPDVASPLSPNEQEETIIAMSTSDVQLPLQDVIVKSAVIAPEFPVQQEIVTTPTEAVVKSVDKPMCFKPRQTGMAAGTKKPTPSKASPAAPAKSATKPAVKSTISSAKPAPAKTAQVKASTTPVSSPKPASKPIAKAPITNGVTKPPVTSTIKATTTSVGVKTAPSKTTTRPATAPAATKPPVKQVTSSVTARPASLTSTRSTAATTVKKPTVTSTVNNAKSTLKPTTVTSPKEPLKPRPATGVSAPTRPKSAPAAKPPSKTPDTEKSIKEAVNKQTASRTTVLAPKPPRKVEPKVPTTARTSLTNKTSTVSKTVGDSKKPQELIRHPPATKTKVTKITTTKVHQNGIDEKVTTVTSGMTIEGSQLIIKDVSPVTENSQLVD